MYTDHQPRLSELGRSGPEGFERVCTFVLLTIRRPLYDAALDYKLVRQGERSGVRSHAAELWEACEDAYENLDDDDAADCIVHILTRIPNIGLAKAGFICQIIYGLSGCIDTHNLTRFELSEREFYLYKDRKRAGYRSEMVRKYNAFCRRAGGAQQLWDDWCAYVSARDPVNYPTPEQVSALHLAPLSI